MDNNTDERRITPEAREIWTVGAYVFQSYKEASEWSDKYKSIGGYGITTIDHWREVQEKEEK